MHKNSLNSVNLTDGDADLEECGDIMSVAGLIKMFLVCKWSFI